MKYNDMIFKFFFIKMILLCEICQNDSKHFLNYFKNGNDLGFDYNIKTKCSHASLMSVPKKA